MKRLVITCIFSAIMVLSFGQAPIEKGYSLLEEGSFAEAEKFFAYYLKTYPDNKSAQICFGRATGLNGQAEEAISYFQTLLNKYPHDLEIRLNYSESLLWAGKYVQAQLEYETLVSDYPESFPALLGYANVLSNLGFYQDALIWVNKALDLVPENGEALLSRKYIRLGLSHQLIGKQEYEEGKKLLFKNLDDFPGDRESLLNLAQTHLATKEVGKAERFFESIARSKKDSIVALLGISLARHIGEDNKSAYEIALKAKDQINSINDSVLIRKIEERNVQAMIWNKKLGDAREEIEKLASRYPGESWLIALEATLGMYSGNSKSSLFAYEQILKKDQASFDGNLGKANALFAEGRMQESYFATFRTLELYENQKDALALLEKLNSVHAPMLEEDVSYTLDNGQNQAFGSRTTARLPWSTKFRNTLSYVYRNTENTISGNKAETHMLLFGLDYKIMPKTSAFLLLGINRSVFQQNGYSQPVVELRINAKPFQLQHLGASFKREVENFNADLTSLEIVKNEIGINYHQSSNFNLGWYTQFSYTTQSDQNEKTLLFTSLYYSMKTKPAIKLGLNYQYLSFKEQFPAIYFSPEEFQAFEVFADTRIAILERTAIHLNAAYGRQKVENNKQTPAFRTSLMLNHKFSKRLSVDVYGRYNNIASATSAGFEFGEVGMRLRLSFPDKLLFKLPKETL